MLDAPTKRRIDSCRDILVGKVPDPKSQVEQITIALIYKFMDDMDADSEFLGGKRSFFAGEYAQYGWANLMSPALGGQGMLDLYSDSLRAMNQNPGIPPLFRDIFKNAYLPYRDPETLRAFLREINGFTYGHSEDLGDAFEYLLSVLGSQGDAGQFRTPRHIIDFIVDIVAPQKGEKILDPACGTAGFLISAYKHIQKANTDRVLGDRLTAEDRTRLTKNLVGYDISPDMVRLSLVNLYLHGFVQPHIEEYDTLTNDSKWNEQADVILANPPFMSPKGGIKPHKRFSVQSNRSEVLFVDYIAEHLSDKGRAGVIVPEGVIFQSGGAYKQLREMLVKKYLIAVISLPAGVFQPYSGVKTSILLMDRKLAKQAKSVLFLKIENDGFGLGAQRRKIEKDDIPSALRSLNAWKESLRSGKDFEAPEASTAHLVAKTKFAGSSDFNLSGDRYLSGIARTTQYELIELGNTDVFQIESGGTPLSTEESYWHGGVHWATLVDLPPKNFITQIRQTERTITTEGLKNSSAKLLPSNTVIVSSRATIGRIGITRIPLATNQGFKNIVIKDTAKVLPEFVAYMMTRLVLQMDAMATGGTFKEISKSAFCTLRLPLPPLDVQKEIVAEIEGYQKVIDGARQVVENYKPHLVVPSYWPKVAIGLVCDLVNGCAFKPEDWSKEQEGGLPIIRIQNLNNSDAAFNFFTGKVKPQLLIDDGDLLFSWSGSRGSSFGPHVWHGRTAILNQHIFKVNFDTKTVARDYLYLALKRAVAEVEENLHGGVGLVHITKGNLERIEVPLPDFETQEAIASQLKEEQQLVEGNKELIRRFEGKIKAAIDRVWGEGTP